MPKILKALNDNHWYLIAALLICCGLVWLYGCPSTVNSMLNDGQKVTRAELKTESDYLLGQIQNRLSDLDRQDELRSLILEQAALFGQTGTFNPMGLLNVLVSVGAISFGLDRNRKYKIATNPTTTKPPAGPG